MLVHIAEVIVKLMCMKDQTLLVFKTFYSFGGCFVSVHRELHQSYSIQWQREVKVMSVCAEVVIKAAM